MGFQIEDGTGSGRSATVTSDNQIATRSESHSLIFHASRHYESAYSLVEVASQAVGASGEEVLGHVQNTSTIELLAINNINVVGYEAHGFCRVYVASAYAAGGTAYTPGNHNRTSGKVASATCYASNGSLTVTGGVQVCTVAISPESPDAKFDFTGSLILGLNDTMDVRFLEQAGATPALGLCIEGYYLPIVQ